MTVLMDGSAAQATTPRRRFQLLDAMILVAAIATSGGVMRSICRSTNDSVEDWCCELIRQAPWDDWLAGAEKVLVLSLLTMPSVAMVTLALIPIRLRGPRPRFRALARQPGLMASCASGVAIAVTGLPIIVGALATGLGWYDIWGNFAICEAGWSVTMCGGLAILVSWMTLFVGGRWRADPSWVDRLGRAMGICWILAAAAVWLAISLVDASWSDCRVRIVNPSLAAELVQRSVVLAAFTMPPVAMVMLALIPIRLVSHGQRFRRLARRPGLMASCASGVAIALIGLQIVVILLADYALAEVAWPSWDDISGWLFDEKLPLLTRCGGLTILVSWLSLFASGKWRADRSWDDRLGRAMGICWILAAFAVTIGSALV